MSAGSHYTCAINLFKQISCWGQNDFGQQDFRGIIEVDDKHDLDQYYKDNNEDFEEVYFNQQLKLNTSAI